jgi:hypothetical protein
MRCHVLEVTDDGEQWLNALPCAALCAATTHFMPPAAARPPATARLHPAWVNSLASAVLLACEVAFCSQMQDPGHGL